MKYAEVMNLVAESERADTVDSKYKEYTVFKANNIDKALWKALLLRVRLSNNAPYHDFRWANKLYPGFNVVDELSSVYSVYNRFFKNGKAGKDLKDIYNGDIFKLSSCIGKSSDLEYIASKLYEYSLTGEDALLLYLMDFDKRYTKTFKDKCKELLFIKNIYKRIRDFDLCIDSVQFSYCAVVIIVMALIIAVALKLQLFVRKC